MLEGTTVLDSREYIAGPDFGTSSRTHEIEASDGAAQLRLGRNRPKREKHGQA
jgi:hypothetical protein